MPKLRPWLLIVIIAVAVAMYFLIIGLRPAPEQTAPPGRPEPATLEQVESSERPVPHEPQSETSSEVEGTHAEPDIRGVIFGVVTTEHGDPVEGAWVELRGFPDQDEVWEGSEVCFYVQSNSDGAFTSPLLEAGDWYVHVIGHLRPIPFPSGRVYVEAGQRVGPVNLRVRAGDGITGRVVGPEFDPIPGAYVFSSSWFTGDIGSLSTPPDGTFVLGGLEPGRYRLRVSADGFLRHEERVDAPVSDLLVQLSRGGRIIGRVVDRETKEPVEDFSVEGAYDVRPSFRSKRWWPEEHYPGGRFEKAGLEYGTYDISVIAPGYAAETFRGICVEEDEGVEELLFELSRGATLEVTVVSAAEKQPVEGAQVFPFFVWDYFPRPSVTNAKGQCELEHLSPGWETIVIRHDEFSEKRVAMEIGEDEQRKAIEVALSKGGVPIYGRVVTGGEKPEPVAAATVQLDRWDFERGTFLCGAGDVTTDQAGEFRFGYFPPGRYELKVEHGDLAPIKLEKSFPEGWNEPLLIVMTTGGTGGRIVGKVTDSQGRPEDEAMVLSNPVGGIGDEDAFTTSDGQYVISGLPLGRHKVTLVPEGPPKAAGRAYQSKFATVRDGQDTRVDFVRGGAAVYGTVTRGGHPVGDKMFSVRPKAGFDEPKTQGIAATDGQGQYRLDGLMPGSYQIQIGVSDDGYGYHAVVREFRMGTEDQRFDIEIPLGVISGGVLNEEGEPVCGARLDLVPEKDPANRFDAIASSAAVGTGWHETSDSGSFCINGVDAGRYRLRVTAFSYGTRLLELEKQEDKDLTNLVIRLEQEAAFACRAETWDKNIPEGIVFFFSDEQGRLVQTSRVACDAEDGTYPVDGVGHERFTVTALASGYAPACCEEVPAQGEAFLLDLDFGAGHDLAVRVVDSAGVPVVGADLLLDPGTDPLLAQMLTANAMQPSEEERELKSRTEEGLTTLRHLNDGNYIVHVRCEGYEDASANVRIAGGDGNVTVRLRPRDE